MALLLGYIYADITSRYLKPRLQSIVHMALLLLSLLWLPLAPGLSWQPHGGENPEWRIFSVLTLAIGLPFVLLTRPALWCRNGFRGGKAVRNPIAFSHSRIWRRSWRFLATRF